MMNRFVHALWFLACKCTNFDVNYSIYFVKYILCNQTIQYIQRACQIKQLGSVGAIKRNKDWDILRNSVPEMHCEYQKQYIM